MPGSLRPHDIQEIVAHGISEREAGRQLRILLEPPKFVALDRPCTPGDGLRVLSGDEIDACLAAFDAATRKRSILKFVPASGAASRMFKTAEAYRRRATPVSLDQLRREARLDGSREAVDLLESIDKLDRFAFHPALRAELAARQADLGDVVARGDLRVVLEALLGKPGLGYAGLPKALLEFHTYPQGSRTAFEEHLVEAADYARDAHGTARLHFTVSPEHRPLFDDLLARIVGDYEHAHRVRFEVGFSVQKPSTDSIALTPDGEVFRSAAGAVLFRPGGHGALIENLADLGGDVVLVKNIDNVVPDHLKRPTFLWKRVLVGLAVSLQDEAFAMLERLDAGAGDPGVVGAAVDFLERSLNVAVPAETARAGVRTLAEFVRSRLDRPLRVCGMVRNEGEPGGGPFWVDGGDSKSVQIVESSQIDPHSSDQQCLFASATHFNPVDLVCALRDRSGRPYELSDFIDEETAFIVEKSSEGRPLRSLERPGLWNGAMAFWNTVFVEVPAETFHPVKTMNDLLRPAHQPQRA